MKRILFAGTSDFAVASLQQLVEENYEIPLVVSQPDRPAGRGNKLKAPPVKEAAQSLGLPVLQTASLQKDPKAREQIFSTPCDFLVVAAFGQILDSPILTHPKIAPLNIHASLLPAYRGAAPIARAIMEGETKTGVTIQWINENLDQGDILTQIPCRIEENDTAGRLHERLVPLGAQALLQCLHSFETNQIRRQAQDPRVGSYASKLKKEETRIHFHQDGIFVHRQIMGMNPWPIAECRFAGQRLRIFESRFIPRDSRSQPGTVVDIDNQGVVVACQHGCISLVELQLEGRRRMPIYEFLKGNPIQTGLVLGGSKNEAI